MARPVLLVPSPNVAENHQYHNAKALEDQGAALVISEKNLEHDFDFFLNQLIDPKKQEEMIINLKKLAQPKATSKIVDLIETLL